VELQYEDLMANKDLSAEIEEVSAWKGRREGRRNRATEIVLLVLGLTCAIMLIN
jgi:hypothetical protein